MEKLARTQQPAPAPAPSMPTQQCVRRIPSVLPLLTTPHRFRPSSIPQAVSKAVLLKNMFNPEE